MISHAHRRLREATQADHQRLESRINILDRIATPSRRRSLVERFHAMHVQVEQALAPWLADLPGLDFEARRRTPHLARDLQVLGTNATDQAGPPVALRGVGHALGWMYVLEGSTLGGRVIRRMVDARGDGMTGLSFLDPYGDRVAERWREFLAVVDRNARSAAEVDELVDGARAGFLHAELQLCEEVAHV